MAVGCMPQARSFCDRWAMSTVHGFLYGIGLLRHLCGVLLTEAPPARSSAGVPPSGGPASPNGGHPSVKTLQLKVFQAFQRLLRAALEAVMVFNDRVTPCLAPAEKVSALSSSPHPLFPLTVDKQIEVTMGCEDGPDQDITRLKYYVRSLLY